MKPWYSGAPKTPIAGRLVATYAGPQMGHAAVTETNVYAPPLRGWGGRISYREAAQELETLQHAILAKQVHVSTPIPQRFWLEAPAANADPSTVSDWEMYLRARDTNLPAARSAASRLGDASFTVAPAWGDQPAVQGTTPASMTNIDPRAYQPVPDAGSRTTSREPFTMMDRKGELRRKYGPQRRGQRSDAPLISPTVHIVAAGAFALLLFGRRRSSRRSSR